jgi:hypothetical protein
MPPEIQKEHEIETYKSIIQIAVEALKLLALFNGGGAIALVTYMTQIAGRTLPTPAPDMSLPLGFYLLKNDTLNP